MGLLTPGELPYSSEGAGQDGGGAAGSWSRDRALQYLHVKRGTAAVPCSQPALPPPARLINPTSNQKSCGCPLLEDAGGGGGLGFCGLRCSCDANIFRAWGHVSLIRAGRRMPKPSGDLPTPSAPCGV